MKNICIIGLGYIGLPTACVLANNGFDILGVDTNENIIDGLNSKNIHIEEPDLKAIFLKALNSKLTISRDYKNSDVFIITVPTPLTKDNKADLSYVEAASKEIANYIEKGNLVILESTSPPGTTEELVGKIINDKTGFVAGVDYFLAFCPERVLPGKIIYELINNDRIIGGINEESAIKAKEIYSSFVKGKIYLTDLGTAELAKLVENTYRDVNIAFSNELSQICNDYNINVNSVIELANKHPRVNILKPGAGVGGHCIPIDPWFILQKIKRENTLIEKCRKINNDMPIIASKKIIGLLKKLERPRVALFGASYKENVGDTRESPTAVIYKELTDNKIEVAVHDPVADNFKHKLMGMEDSLNGSDCLVLLVGHDLFKKINFENVYKLMRTRNIFDTRNFFDKKKLEKAGFNYYML